MSKPIDYAAMESASSPVPVMYVAPRTNGFAIASMVCGIVSILFAGLILGPLAIIFGYIAMKNIDERPSELEGRGMAKAGIICGIVALVLQVIYIVIYWTMINRAY